MAATQTEFVHLHVHSEYSLLDGLSRVPELVAEAQRHGMPAVALTDHGVLHGAIEFYQAAREHGVKPIVGVEAYVAQRRMTDRESADRASAHLVLLAKDETGYRNLLALVSKAHLEGFYYRPRIDHETLAEHREGLIALSGCASGEVPWAIRQEDLATARKTAEFYRDLFGPEDYYLELQSHGIDFQPAVNRELITLAKQLDLQLVCTNDSHYTRRDDSEAQDLLLCIQTNALFDDPKRMRMYTGEHYLKSPEEMAQVFGAEVPEALANTLRVAERCDLQLKFGRLDLPKLPFVPDEVSPDEFLARLCWENVSSKYDHVTTEIEDRLRYELDVVRTTGFAAYILFVWDFTDFARQRGIFCSPRGSAAGSIILYVLGITLIDPVANALTFERFLNPERIQMPDIDMDFADSRRDEVIEYVAQRYGRDHVAQIVTFGRLLARAAIRDVGRALAYPLTEVDRVAKLVPGLPVGMTIDKALQTSEELAQLYKEEPHITRLLDLARKVEGISRHSGTHAAGVVVSGEPLIRHVPLQRGTKGESLPITQYEMHALADIGLLKEDFLGLTNLTLLENAIKLIEETRGERVDLQRLPANDPATFEMLSNGDSTGVFQLEGAGMRRTLREFRPTTLDHLAAIVALYRPGPMAHIPTYVAAKDGRVPITFLHPKLEPILEPTYGVIVFQDQVLQIVQAIAGFTLGHADVLRNAMGKKIRAQMEQERDNFLSGAADNGVEPDVAKQIWEYIEPFAGYAFNRAHAYCYAQIAYQTAYLKCRYPAEYMAAMLSTQYDDTEKIIAASGECRRLGISLVPPSVNRSQIGFAVEDEGSPTPSSQSPDLSADGRSPSAADPARIRYGLAAVKNVGAGAARLMVEEREQRGEYRSVEDLCQRLDLRTVNKRTLEALTKAGALDDFGPRERILASLDRAIAAAQQVQKAAGLGQGSLFTFDEGLGSTSDLPRVPPATSQQLVAWEKEAFGFYLTNHPFAGAAGELAAAVTANTSQIGEELAGERVTLAGAIMHVRRVITKKQETMAIARLEDLHGGIDAVVFPRTYAANPGIWREDAILVVDGKVDIRRGEGAGEEAPGVPEILVQTAREWRPGERAEPSPISPHAPTGGNPAPADSVAKGTVVGVGPGEGVSESRSDKAPSAGDRPDYDFPLPGVPFEADFEASASLDESRLQGWESEGEPGPVPAEGVMEDAPPHYASGEADHASAESLVGAPLQEPSESGPAPPRPLVFVLRESGDRNADAARMRQLHELVSTAGGEDHYEIVFEGSQGRQRLVGDNLRVHWTPEIKEAVESILGADAVC